MKRLLSPSLLATSFLTTIALAQPAFAQNATNPPATTAPQASDDEAIIVTAQRRGENILSVPLSITATTGEQLTNLGVDEISDLQFTTPGVLPSLSSGYTQIYIRGIGNSIFVGADPSVATFIDDVPRIYGSMVNNFVDVSRVEVIKGAPGGLYGRNATGGAINIITRQPSLDDIVARGNISYGEHATFQSALYASFPIVGDHVALSMSIQRRQHDPYIKNITTSHTQYTAAMFPGGSNPFGIPALHMTPQQTADFYNSGLQPQKGYVDEDFWATDGKLLVKASDNFKITFAADYASKEDSNGNGIFTIAPGAVQGTLGGFLFLFGGANPLLPPGFIVAPTKKFTVSKGLDAFANLKDWGVSATAVLSLPGIDITSISAYRKQHTFFLEELSGANACLFESVVNIHKRYIYQELRGVSTGDGPLHYIVGASYLKTHFRGATDLNIIAPLVMGSPIARTIDEVKNWSGYGQVEYDITDHLSATVSGRYIHETNDSSFLPTGTAHQVEKKFLPSATISYKLEGGGNIYARYARGFKAGGVNPVASPGAFPNPATDGGIFKGETVDTFEAGVRTSLLDHKLQITTAVFYNNYKNVQFATHANEDHADIILAIVNAGDARTYGAEASINWRVIDPLTLGATVGYLNAKYKNFGVAGSTVLENFDLSHTQMTNAPKWQMAFTANLDQPVGDHFRVVGNVLASYLSDSLFAQPGSSTLPAAVGPSYWLVNARIGIRTADDHVGLSVYANNLFNKGYVTYGSSAAATGTLLTWGDPRVVGVQADFKF